MRILHARAWLSAGILALALVWLGMLLLALPAQAEQRIVPEQTPRGPNALPGIVFNKWVANNPACSTPQSVLEVAADTTVYFCYRITNTSAETVTLTTLMDDNDSTVVIWSTEGRRPLPPSGMLDWSVPGVNLIRPVSFRNSTNSVAAWTLESGGNAYIVESAPPATINIVQPKLASQLTVAANTPLCSTTTTADVRLVNNNAAYGHANFCLTITNNGDITLTEHIVNIPVLGINNQVFTATLTPINSAVAVSRSLVITYGSPLGLAWTAALSRTIIEATLTAQAVVTSTTENKNSTSASAIATVNGPTTSSTVQRFFADKPDQCSDDTSATGRTGVTVYYCVVIRNTSAVSPELNLVQLVTHEIFDSASGGRAIVQAPIAGGESLTVTNSFLAANGLPQILGPISYKQAGTFSSQSVVTSTNATFGFKTSGSATTSIVVSVPPEDTATPTNTPLPTFTPFPTVTPFPPPPIPTIPPTFTPAPTWTPSPTVVIITTPGGQPPTPYPQIGSGGLVQPTTNPFVSPLQPGVFDPAAATATAAVLFGLVPPADPFAATATAQALFGLPPADPFAATATAQALFGLPPADPFAATATAQALFGLPPADPFAATATAQALFGLPPADPFAATATAQALMVPLSPLETPTPDAVAVLPPGVTVITVTATSMADLTSGPTQRPMVALAPEAPGTVGTVFRSIAGGAFWALAIIGMLAGGVLFLLLAGVLAGFSIAGPSRNKYDLVGAPPGEDTTPSPPVASAAPAESASAPADDTEWPDTLP
ncbi:MAG: hypothetical protein M9936_04255 [Caldilinea sp.]|nr:hypothetical protein [Caldilineaceae bacterium]MCB9120643.1 hypothetical protein [Caldilineaceae bacterium]MCB9124003.1 hypothetical protein [Caldilineaceae bacterium]MCO5208883.1 hypothetical protein [Caldilinea sp.]MCW5840328.1 hypothetical protein [Caldilinea sp.]